MGKVVPGEETGSNKKCNRKILQKLKELKNAINKIDRDTVEQWVRDLVIVKTFAGLRFHEAILKKGAELKRANYRLSEPKEESTGIDGFISNIPVSIKPHTYKAKPLLPEHIEVKIIYYRKIDGGIEIDYGEIL